MPITPTDIRRRMAELELTQADLARRTGIAPSHLSAMLAGRRPIGMDTADRIAAAMECRVGLVVERAKPRRSGSV